MKRVATALVGAPLLVAAVYFAPPWATLLVVLAAVVGGGIEYHRITTASGIETSRFLLLGGAVFAVVAVGAPVLTGAPRLGFLSTGFLVVAVAMLAFVESMARRKDLARVLPSVGATLLGVVYVGLMSASWLQLRLLPQGASLLLVLLAVTWGSDTGAYYTGRLLGRHKLAPGLSPNKTVEGSVGGAIVGTLAGVLLAGVLGLGVGVLPLGALCLGLALVGQLGDLAQSALKRGAGLKDSGRILPGHGGVLDRLDSLLFAGPVMYHCWTILFLP